MKKHSSNSFLRKRLPAWLKSKLPSDKQFFRLRSMVHQRQLHTVCESASCPNIGECWGRGTLTLMILGDHCTRACRFCDVPTGAISPPDPEEPLRLAKMLAGLDMSYAVITSVDRDDLHDGGAGHWADTIRQIRKYCPTLTLEALLPDFKGEEGPITTVCQARPDIFAHNMETVASLQKRIRPQCRYDWSLDVLKMAARKFGMTTKSGLMLGHGEHREEVVRTMQDLLETGCRLLSIGQYLQPSKDHLPVVEYIHPDVFLEYQQIGEEMGFDHVESGPMVRSSYKADQQAISAGIL